MALLRHTRQTSMMRFIPLLTFLAIDSAQAAPVALCHSMALWCDGMDVGLMWIPTVVVFQFIFLYLIRGGRGVVLGSACANERKLQGKTWGLLQVGFPIALVLSYPIIVALMLFDKWVQPIGPIEIVLAQGLYCLVLARNSEWTAVQPLPSVVGEKVASISPVTVPSTPTTPNEMHPTTLAPSPSSSNAPDATSQLDMAALIKRLENHYMWNEIGDQERFRLARKSSIKQLIGAEDISQLGEPLLEAMRCVARHSISLYRFGNDEMTLADIVAKHSLPGFDDYSAEVMQRLVYSVLASHQKLFLDQTDLEVFGEDFIDSLYRLAIFEVKSSVARLVPLKAAA